MCPPARRVKPPKPREMGLFSARILFRTWRIAILSPALFVPVFQRIRINSLPSLTVENYVKSIFLICQDEGVSCAATGQIAGQLQVSPGTVTSMLKTLSESGLATYVPYEGVRLTRSGVALALRVLRRHRLIEQFLSRTLSLSWDEVHEEAENMEHAVSDRLIDRIDAFLGFPKADPHGDPIPAADGTLEMPNFRPLASCQVGDTFRFDRVTDQSPEFLRFLTETGLELQTVGSVVACRLEAGTITIHANLKETTLAIPAAEKILVTTPV